MIRSRRARRWLTGLIVATAGLCAGMGTAQAAPHGGHGGGAGHGPIGGFRPGGFHGPVGHGFRGYYGYPWGYGAFGFGLGFGLGYGYGGYGWGYPYGGYGYGYPYPGYAYPGYVYPNYVYPWDAPYYAASAPVALPQTAATGETSFQVRTPAGSALWVNGERSRQGGPVHDIVSGGLLPGRTYTYDFRVEYEQADGKHVERSRSVSARAGGRYVIDFSPQLPPPKPVEVIIPPPAQP